MRKSPRLSHGTIPAQIPNRSSGFEGAFGQRVIQLVIRSRMDWSPVYGSVARGQGMTRSVVPTAEYASFSSLKACGDWRPASSRGPGQHEPIDRRWISLRGGACFLESHALTSHQFCALVRSKGRPGVGAVAVGDPYGRVTGSQAH